MITVEVGVLHKLNALYATETVIASSECVHLKQVLPASCKSVLNDLFLFLVADF